MNKNQIQNLDDLTLDLYFNLAILNSAVKNGEDLEICALEGFVSNIYENSINIRKIFENGIY